MIYVSNDCWVCGKERRAGFDVDIGNNSFPLCSRHCCENVAGMIARQSGYRLDAVGEGFGIARYPGERDNLYRVRLDAARARDEDAKREHRVPITFNGFDWKIGDGRKRTSSDLPPVGSRWRWYDEPDVWVVVDADASGRVPLARERDLFPGSSPPRAFGDMLRSAGGNSGPTAPDTSPLTLEQLAALTGMDGSSVTLECGGTYAPPSPEGVRAAVLHDVWYAYTRVLGPLPFDEDRAGELSAMWGAAALVIGWQVTAWTNGNAADDAGRA